MNVPGDTQILASAFVEGVISQAESMRRGDSSEGNQHARRYMAAIRSLQALGSAGREALVPLMSHERADVRVMAAAFLLRHCTAQALRVLDAEAKGSGLAAFGASEAKKRWLSGEWALDPLD